MAKNAIPLRMAIPQIVGARITARLPGVEKTPPSFSFPGAALELEATAGAVRVGARGLAVTVRRKTTSRSAASNLGFGDLT